MQGLQRYISDQWFLHRTNFSIFQIISISNLFYAFYKCHEILDDFIVEGFVWVDNKCMWSFTLCDILLKYDFVVKYNLSG